MQFTSDKAIYLQIADYICEQLLRGNWKVEEKIPSVREMAVLLEVNPNTVARAYSYLETQQVIYTQRGIGYFVKLDGINNSNKLKRATFLCEHVPNLFKHMQLLNIKFTDLEKLYRQYQAEK